MFYLINIINLLKGQQMNERDYSYIQYLSLLTGVIIICNIYSFSYFYHIPITITSYLAMLIILNLSLWIAFIAFFKRKFLALEFYTALLNENRKGR